MAPERGMVTLLWECGQWYITHASLDVHISMYTQEALNRLRVIDNKRNFLERHEVKREREDCSPLRVEGR